MVEPAKEESTLEDQYEMGISDWKAQQEWEDFAEYQSELLLIDTQEPPYRIFLYKLPYLAYEDDIVEWCLRGSNLDPFQVVEDCEHYLDENEESTFQGEIILNTKEAAKHVLSR